MIVILKKKLMQTSLISILRAYLSICFFISLTHITQAEEPTPQLLWENGALGSEGLTGKGTTQLFNESERIVTEIHEPTLWPYLASPETNTGTAIILFPGGGHRELWTDHEGHNIAQWFAQRGISAFVVYYRLSEYENSPYNLKEHSLADAQQAIRLVRHNASQWNIDPSKIGIMGFSAGGELAALAGAKFDKKTNSSNSPLAAVSSRPDFQALVYPINLEEIELPENPPPAFLLCGYHDDSIRVEGLMDYCTRFKKLGVPAELHIYAEAGHGFGLREDDIGPHTTWLNRLQEWMTWQGF